MESSVTSAWRKASYSGNGGGDCIETASGSGQVYVRDTKNRQGLTLSVPASAWAEFITSVK